ncbi:uncharacterized protein N0V89_011790 [Didymosphaeria variabile]|uniref:Dipeptidyl-peptidase V n=1 Tax=Didymosphaeria variabile TaxID=1932322 RepID=A0A9W8XAF0_9PLEO|nr:uncharacterized protein N0V89_011790 [Didymosphaeria variabile]KAJ4345656.1 hypothetical protein N0V89_011790 [Didymosphaeria variabile]
MTIRANKFTPEVLLSAPRRSEGNPNSDGSKILYSTSTYSFEEHAKTSEIRVLDVKSGETSLISDSEGASEPQWLDDDTVLLLSEGKEATSVKVGPVKGFGNSYDAGTIKGSVGNVKLVSLDDGAYGIAVTGKATPSGDLYNEKEDKKPQTSGRLYNSLFVRHWDHWVTDNRNAIFLATLKKDGDKYKLSQLKNALKGSQLESPVEPFGGTDNFDISSHGLVFTAKDPDLNPATHTKTNIYTVTAKDFWSELSKGINEPFKVPIHGFEGASTRPTWDNEGKAIAFFSMRTDGYESDKNQVFIIPDWTNPGWVQHLWASEDGKGSWDRSPQSITWGANQEIYFTAEEAGRISLFASSSDFSKSTRTPKLIVKGGGISSAILLKDGSLFLSSSSLIENSLYSMLPASAFLEISANGGSYSLPLNDSAPGQDPATRATKYVSSNTRSGSTFGLSRDQIEEIWFPGANNKTYVHAWVFKPSNFKKGHKYPLAYFIHGGPQGAWEDSWSTRWNPAVFAEQGYVVVAPNPTGSTGYGQDFTDAIKGQWGGLPYQDLVKGFEYIKENLPYVDIERSVALGASYGGYMMNWIQGHDLGRQFKALVTHDGVFSMTAQMASEELYFPFHDIGGKLWENPEGWAQWDPSRFAGNWATPHLIIHSEKDYRLTMNEGLAAFNVLQVRGVPSQFLTFPDENHWVLKPENSLLWHETVLDWINEYAGLEKYTEWRAKNGAVRK